MKTLLKNKTSQHAFQTLVQQKYEKILCTRQKKITH